MVAKVQGSSTQETQREGSCFKLESCSPKKITLSPIVKGVIAGLVGALALGLIFGPVAAILGFCLGFGSAFFSTCLSSNCQSIQADNKLRRKFTAEQIEKDPEAYFKHLDKQRQRIDLLRQQARKSLESI